MSETAVELRRLLEEVDKERELRAADPALGAKVLEIKRYQHSRFALTYADLLAEPGTRPAARFFLEDLYGPRDFASRDQQFARIVEGVVRVLPAPVVQTVHRLLCLHALSERLDTAMGRALSTASVNDASYASAWRRVGCRLDREAQISLMLEIGQALERHTRNPLLRTSLRLMRGPAKMGGFSALQDFLEAGFDAFKALPDVGWFLNQIAIRELTLGDQLFHADGA